MSRVAVLVPCLGRPHRIAPTLEAFMATTPGARVYFIADPHDRPDQDAIRAMRGNMLVLEGGYASKINFAVRHTDEELLFFGATDLEPQPGWFEAAVAKLTGGVQVIGINDLLRRDREHATHFLMTREYAELPTIDGARGPLWEGYHAWYCDDEFVAVAKFRGAYAYAADAHVRHLHYLAGAAPDDDTYALGRGYARIDGHTFARREHLWM